MSYFSGCVFRRLNEAVNHKLPRQERRKPYTPRTLSRQQRAMRARRLQNWQTRNTGKPVERW
jgi:hypothetical protein